MTSMDPVYESSFRDLATRIANAPLLADLDLPALARPCLQLVTQRASVQLGESRIGGTPDVPPGFEWPRWAPQEEPNRKSIKSQKTNPTIPLGFIAQIDLSTIPRVGDLLPGTGWLYFFYDVDRQPWGFDPADRGCCRVVYASCDRSSLQRIKPPDDADPSHLSECCPVSVLQQLSLPSGLPQVEYGSPTHEALERLRDELAMSTATAHQLLGHPDLIQNPMELECQLASNGIYCGNPEGYKSAQAKSLEAGAADWRLLLQIDSDEDGPGWMWGDCGRIFFWIREQELRALRFDNAWLVLQCF